MNVYCGSCSHAQIQYGVVFPQRRKFKCAVVLTCVLMWLCYPLAARAISLSFQIDHRSCSFTLSPTNSNTGRHLGFEHDCNYHIAFRTCYIIMRKVYSNNDKVVA